MYERMKAEFAIMLAEKYSVNETKDILMMLNIVAENYEVKERETALVVWEEDAIPKLVKEYLVVKKIEGLSELTLKNYRIFLEKFFVTVRKEPQMVEKNDIVLFLYRYKSEHDITDRSLDKIREYLCRFFNWACDGGYIDKSPARTIKPIKYEVKEREGLTQLELEYIRNACTNLRDRAMIEFFYSTGCRVSELTILKKEDINLDTGVVHLFGKGKKHRGSYLNAKAKVALSEYWLSRGDDNEHAFVSMKGAKQLNKEGVEKAVRNIAERSGITKHVTPHVLRHTTATQGLENGMPVESIQKLLGHSSINTTMIYAKTSKERVMGEHKRCVI